jgi:hypothetical protein
MMTEDRGNFKRFPGVVSSHSTLDLWRSYTKQKFF